QIAIEAFPTLFPTGKADFAVSRDINVTMSEWAAHFLQLDGGHFARHLHFQYWALNTIMRDKARKEANWYTNSHPDEHALSVADI
ncbi:hypothetical protein F5879DRAFT_808991, partial [Lentinula edodes]